jgi:hypothetical protein
MLSELVELDSDVCKGSPSADSSHSSMGMSAGNSTLCTPCTTQMMSFSPMADRIVKGATVGQRYGQAAPVVSTSPLAANDAPPPSPAAGAFTNQVVDKSMMGTNPTQRSGDASQRSTTGGSLLGAAAAGGDASQRNPVGRVSLGTAVIGGDASQRSVTNQLGDQSFARLRCPSTQVFQNSCPSSSWKMDCSQALPLTPCEARGGMPQDAQHGSTAESFLPTFAAEGGSDALKSWLSGPVAASSSVSDMDLVERLRAAAPETYED